MQVAVVYTSKYGTTKRCAELIARKAGGQAFRLEGNTRPTLADCNVVIMGAPLYFGAIPQEMTDYCLENRNVLLKKKLYLFVLGIEPKPLEGMVQVERAFPDFISDHAEECTFIGGEIDFQNLTYLEQKFVKDSDLIGNGIDKIDETALKDFCDTIISDKESKNTTRK